MRRGFMNMFPGFINQQDFFTHQGGNVYEKVPDPKAKDGNSNQNNVNENTTQKLSIFSTIDSKSHGGNENGTIELSEANTSSVFNQINGSENYQKSVGEAGIKSNIIKDQTKLQNIKPGFDTTGKFAELLNESFNKAKSSLKNIEKTVTVKTSERDAAIQQHRGELDNRVENTLRSINANANANLMSAYQDALMRALADAENKGKTIPI